MIEFHYQQLQESFAYYTECALATLEYHRGLKRPVQHELRRAENIADGMVLVCLQHQIQPTRCPRLEARLKQKKP